MKRLCSLLACALPLALHAEDLRLADGSLVRGEIVRVDPDGPVVTTAEGARKSPFDFLPTETQQRLGYDRGRAEAYRQGFKAAQAEAAAQAGAAIRAEADALEAKRRAQPTADETERLVRVEASGFHAQATISRGTSAGSFVSLSSQTGRAATTMLNKDTRRRVSLGQGFVHELQRVAGETWSGKLYPAGYQASRDENGEETLIRAYALSAATALAKGGDGRPVISGTTDPNDARTKLPGTLRGDSMLNKR